TPLSTPDTPCLRPLGTPELPCPTGVFSASDLALRRYQVGRLMPSFSHGFSFSLLLAKLARYSSRDCMWALRLAFSLRWRSFSLRCLAKSALVMSMGGMRQSLCSSRWALVK